jgi:hypothetical protein
VYAIRNVDDILDFITAGIVSALNSIAPEKEIKVKSGPNLYLTRETLEALRMPDSATGTSTSVTRSHNSSGGTSRIATSRPSRRPATIRRFCGTLRTKLSGKTGPTTTPREAADVMNKYFIDKVDDL